MATTVLDNNSCDFIDGLDPSQGSHEIFVRTLFVQVPTGGVLVTFAEGRLDFM